MMNTLANFVDGLGSLPPLAYVALLLFIHNLLPAAPGEEDVWASRQAVPALPHTV